MPQLKNTKRRIVLKSFKSFGFRLVGNNGRHANHLVRGQLSISFPTYKEFSVDLIRELLQEANISENEWENAWWDS